jgi:hypothetical protein
MLVRMCLTFNWNKCLIQLCAIRSNVDTTFFIVTKLCTMNLHSFNHASFFFVYHTETALNQTQTLFEC